jgi:gas vesicle protein
MGQVKEGCVNESRVMAAGAMVGALVGAMAGYLFFTDRGKEMRDRLEPAVDDLKREFARFQTTVEKLGEMANNGIRAVNEFNAARGQSTTFGGSRTSH